MSAEKAPGRGGPLIGAGFLLALCCIAGPAILGLAIGATLGIALDAGAAVLIAVGAALVVRRRRAAKQGCC